MAIEQHVHCVWNLAARCFRLKFGKDSRSLTSQEYLTLIENGEEQLRVEAAQEFFLRIRNLGGNSLTIHFTGPGARKSFQQVVEYLAKVYDCWNESGIKDGQHKIGEG